MTHTATWIRNVARDLTDAASELSAAHDCDNAMRLLDAVDKLYETARQIDYKADARDGLLL